MKTKFFVIVILIMTSVVVTASPFSNDFAKSKSIITIRQTPVPAFAFFRTHRQGAGITATWGLTSEQGVTGFLIQRTYEDPNDPYAFWEDIFALPCTSNRSYKHTDQNVSPGYISYRVIAFFQFGGSMMSEISTEHIVSH